MKKKLTKAEMGFITNLVDASEKARKAAMLIEQNKVNMAVPAVGALNLGLDMFHANKVTKDNKAYEDYWRNEYQTPSLVSNPTPYGDPTQMEAGGIFANNPNKNFAVTPKDAAKLMKWLNQKMELGGITGPGDPIKTGIGRGKDVLKSQTLEADRTIGGALGLSDQGQRLLMSKAIQDIINQRPQLTGDALLKAQQEHGYTDPKSGDYFPTNKPGTRITPQEWVNYGSAVPGDIAKYYYGGGITSGNVGPKVKNRKSNPDKTEKVRVNAETVDRDQATIEAEAGEKIMGQGLYSIGGKSHAEGGTPIIADQGDFIFSDSTDLAFPQELAKMITGKEIAKAKSRTPAALADRYKKLNENMLQAQKGEYDDLNKKTALYNIQNYMKKLGQIAEFQEAMKGYPDGRPEMARLGGKIGSNMPIYNTGGPNLPYEDIDPYKGNKHGTRKRQQQRGLTSKFNQFSAPWLGDYGFENTKSGADSAIKSLGFSGDINDNKSVQKFLVDNLSDHYNTYGFEEGSTEFERLMKKYNPTNQGIRKGYTDTDVQGNFGTVIDSGDKQDLYDNYVDGDFGVRSAALMKAALQLKENRNPGTRLGILPPVNSPKNINPLVPSLNPPQEVAKTQDPGTGPESGPQFTTRDYNSTVLPNIAEMYGLYAANKRRAPRYPTAQKFYEGDNIDAILNSAYTPLTAQAEQNAAQRARNAAASNLPTTPLGMSRQIGLDANTQNAYVSATGAIERLNIQRKDQLAAQLAQNQVVKGQQRLQLQKNYINEMETVKNNMEIADKLRMSQTSNLLNAYTARSFGTKYINAMADNFQIDPFGNLKALPVDIAKAAKSSRSSLAGTNPIDMLKQISEMIRQGTIDPAAFSAFKNVDDFMRATTSGQPK
jgi:hypothetical protein